MALAIEQVHFPTDLSRGARGFADHPCSLTALGLRLPYASAASFLGGLDWREVGLADVQWAVSQTAATAQGMILSSATHCMTPFRVEYAVLAQPRGSIAVVAKRAEQFGHSGLSEAQLLLALQSGVRKAVGAAAKAPSAWCTVVRVATLFAHLALPACGWRKAKTNQLSSARLTRGSDAFHLEVQQLQAGEASAPPVDAAAASDEATTTPSEQALCDAALGAGPLSAAAAALSQRDGCAAAHALSALAQDDKLPDAARAVAGRWLLSEACVDAHGEAAQQVRALGDRAKQRLCTGDSQSPPWATPLCRIALQLAWPASLLAELPLPQLFAGFFEAAADALGSWAQQAPDDQAALARVGAAALVADSAPQRANEWLEEAFAAGLQWACVSALGQRVAASQQDTDRFSRWAKRWRSAVEIPGAAAFAAAYAARAFDALRATDVSTARELAGEALQRDPAMADAQAALAVVDGEAGRGKHVARARQLAEQLLRVGMAAEPEQAAPCLHAAGIAWRDGVGDAAAAQQAFERALRACPAHVPSLRALGALYLGQHRAPQAAQAWSDALAAAHQLPRGHADQLDQNERLELHLRLLEMDTGPAPEPSDAAQPEGAAQTDAFSAHLRAALALAPGREAACRRLEQVLVHRHSVEPLAELWLRNAELRSWHGDEAGARAARRNAARLFATQAHDPTKACALLWPLLEADADDAEALALLLPLVDDVQAERVLGQAAACAPDALARGQWHAVWATRCARSPDMEPQRKARAYRRVLRELPQHLGAATGLVDVLLRRGGSEPSHHAGLALAYEELGHAAAAAPERAAAYTKAARSHLRAQAPAAAERAVACALSLQPDRADAWRLRLQLSETRGDALPLRQAMVAQAIRASGHTSDAHPLWLQQADISAAAGDAEREQQALEEVVRRGGASRAVCERLLGVLAQAGDTAAQLQWLLHFADAGWPLPVAESYLQAAELAVPDHLPVARRALRAALAVGGATLWQAASQLRELSQTHQWLDERALALEGQLRALDEGSVGHGNAEALETELMWAHAARGAMAEAETACHALLAHNAHHAAGHVFLAERLVARHAWDEALDHFVAALIGPMADTLPSQRRRQAWEMASALCAALRPALLMRVVSSGDANAAVPGPMEAAAALRRSNDFAGERALLRHLLSTPSSAADPKQVRQRLAEQLIADAAASPQELQEAESLLRQSLVDSPRDVAARKALASLAERTGRLRDVAELHFALSQLIAERDEAFAHVVKSAQALMQSDGQRATAAQIVLAFARRQDVELNFRPLHQAMRELGLHAELAQHLGESLERAPIADDGRLAELVTLLCGPLQDTEKAAQWCQRFVQHVPHEDAPWQLLVDTLLQAHNAAAAAGPLGEDAAAPSAANAPLDRAAAVFRAWAQARTGRARSQVMAALSVHLEQSGEPHAALQALQEALAGEPEAAPDIMARLQAFIEKMEGSGAFAEAAAAREQRRRATLDPQQKDDDARALAHLYETKLAAPGKAFALLQGLRSLTEPECGRLVQTAMAAQAWDELAQSAGTLLRMPMSVREQLVERAAQAQTWGLLAACASTWILQASNQAPSPEQAQRAAQAAFSLVVAHGGRAAMPAWSESDSPASEAVAGAAGHAERARPKMRTDRRGDEAAYLAFAFEAALALAGVVPAAGHDALVAAAALARAAQFAAEGDAGAAPSPRPWVAKAQARLTEEACAQALVGYADLSDENDAACALVVALAAKLPELAERAAQHVRAQALAPALRAEALAAQARGALRAGDSERAQTAIDALAALDPERAEPLLLQTLQALGRHEEVIARRRVQAQSKTGPEAAQAWTTLGQACMQLGRADEADEALQHVPAPLRGPDWSQLAWESARARGDAEASLAVANSALAQAPAPPAEQRARWLRRQADVLWWELGDAAQAHQALLQAHALQPRSAGDWVAHADGLPSELAVRRLREALVVLPAAAQAPVWQRLCELGPATEALACLQEGLRCLGEATLQAHPAAAQATLGQEAIEAATALALSAQRAGAWALHAQALQALAQCQRAATPDVQCDAWLEAAYAWLAIDAEPAQAKSCLHQAGQRLAQCTGSDTASLRRRFFYASEACAAQAGDVRGLVALYAQAPSHSALPEDVITARLRRAAYLAASHSLGVDVAALWQTIRARDGTDEQAALCAWRHQMAALAQQGTQEALATLVADMEATLSRLPPGKQRVATLRRAARMWPASLSDGAIAMVGTQFNAIAVAQQGPFSSADDARWIDVCGSGDTLLDLLDRARRPHDALSVAGRLAHLAPAPQRTQRLLDAGARARGVGDNGQAYSYLRAAASSDAASDAWEFCLAYARSHLPASEVVALYTERASRAEPAVAAQWLAQAATLAQAHGADAREAMRLYASAHQLHPSGPVLMQLIELALAEGNDPYQAADAFDAGLLGHPAAIACAHAIGDALLTAPPQARRLLAFCERLHAALGADESIRALRLALARCSQAERAVLDALLAARPHDHALAMQYAAEAAHRAHALQAFDVARENVLTALADPAAPPSWGWLAWQLLQGNAAYGAALEERLRPLLGGWQRFAASPPAPPNAPDNWQGEQVAIWRLQSARAVERGDVAAAAGALEVLVGWLGDAPMDERAAALGQWAHALHQQGAHHDAMRALTQVATAPAALPARRIEASLQLAAWARAAGDAPRAGDLLQSARALLAQAPQMAPQLAMAQLDYGDVAAAHAAMALPDGAALAEQSPARLLALLACQCMARLQAGDAPSDAPGEDAVAVAQTLEEMGLRSPLPPWAFGRVAESQGDAAQAAAHFLEAERRLAGDDNAGHAIHLTLPAALQTSLWQRWARLAWQQGDAEQALTICLRGVAIVPAPAPLLALACELAERAGQWERAAEFAESLAARAGDAAQQLQAARRAAQIHRVHLGDWQAAARALWAGLQRCGHQAGNDAQLQTASLQTWQALWEVLDAAEPYLGPSSEWTARRLQAAEQVMLHTPAANLQNEAGLRLALAFAPQDAAKANTLFRLVSERQAVPPPLRAVWQEAALQAGDDATFASLAQQAEEEFAALPAPDAGQCARAFARRVQLARAQARLHQDASQALGPLEKALALVTMPVPFEQVPLLKQAAELCAAIAPMRPQAAWLYEEVLRHTPLDVDALRMAARLAGGENDTDRAWGLYACLLWLLPDDAEAGRFVMACRAQPSDAASAGPFGAPPSEAAPSPQRSRPMVRKVQQVLEDIAAEGLLAEAQRPSRAYDVAQLLRADIEVVLAGMVTALPSQPRAHALTKIPEAYQLFRFAQSPAYFTLRERLGA